jgi:2'-5' RNA ligase
MKGLFSVWLTPEEKDKEYLDKIIRELASVYSSPVFIPHLTLLPDVETELEKLKTSVEKTFQDIKSFKIKTERANQSEAFFKTVFVEFELNETLKNLFIEFSVNKFGRDISVFKPHISLMYKTMPKEEKLKVVSSLEIKDEFAIGNVYIVTPRKGARDFNDVHGWRTVYRQCF